MYLKAALMSFKKESSYRIHIFASILNSIIRLAVLWFLWMAIFNFSASEAIEGFTFNEMITYASISTIISFAFSSWLQFDIQEDVKTGKISNILTKPFNYIVFRISGDFGRIFFKILTTIIPLALISVFIMKISLPLSPLFFISIVIGLFINVFFSVLIGLWTFWSKGGIWGITQTKGVISEIMSGALIPIYFFPEWLKSIAYFLPFQAVYNIPLSIYIGKITGYEILINICTQLFWFLVLALLVFTAWKYSEKRVIVYGG